MILTKMKIKDLKPHPKNEEIYGYNEDIFDLVEKIHRSNLVHTLVVNSKGFILAGHRRQRACRQLGIKEVDVEIRDFDSEEEEIEFIIDNNATREKTVEQKAREAKALKEVESVLAEKRKISSLKQNKSTDTPKLAERSEKGETRNIVAQKVGLKSGHEVDRAITTINAIDNLSKKGDTEKAELVRSVLNNGSISTAAELAKNIDIVEIPEEDKELVKSGKKSPFTYIEEAKKKKKGEKKKPETEVKQSSEKELEEEIDYTKMKFEVNYGGAEPENNVKYSWGCDIDDEKFEVELAQRLQVSISSFISTLNYYVNEIDSCKNMPPIYKGAILEQGEEAIEKLKLILKNVKIKGDNE